MIKFKKLIIIVFIFLTIIISYFFFIKPNMASKFNNQQCIEIIKNYYKGINEGDYKKSYNLLYNKSDFATYERLAEFWESSFEKIEVKSIEKYDIFHENNKKKFVYQVELYYHIKENPSKYLTRSHENYHDIAYTIIEPDDTGTLKISRTVHLYDKKDEQ